MRYGENPHQTAGFYVTGDKRPGVATARQLQGKQLSYNNINDTDAAFELVGEFDPARSAAVAIIKHANPCGVADGATLGRPIARRSPAIPSRPSAASSRSTALLDAEAAEEIVKIFTEVIIAPDASEEAQADRRGQEEPAPAGHRRPARSARAGHRRSSRSPAACWSRRATTPWSTISN